MAKNDIVLSEGMKLTFYNEDEDNNGNRDDLIVESTIEFDKKRERWTAKIDWDEIKNISQFFVDERKKN